MKFYTYHLAVDQLARVTGMARDKIFNMGMRAAELQDDPITFRQGEWERAWLAAKRPYYRVWPSILPMLTKLKLDRVPSNLLHKPNGLNSLLIELPQGNNLLACGDIQFLFVSFGRVTSQGEYPITIGAHFGEVHREYIGSESITVPIWEIWTLALSDTPILEQIDALPKLNQEVGGYQLTEAERKTILSLACTLCLLDSDPDLISPDVLAADRGKALTEKLVEKARRRGKYGWNIGASIEKIPHYRRPHPALVHYGIGRQKSKVILRSGAIVHRSKVEKIPTGFKDNEQ